MLINQYSTTMREVATDFDAISQNLFQIARDIEKHGVGGKFEKMQALTRCAEVNTVRLRSLAMRTKTRSMELDADEGLSAVAVDIKKKGNCVKITVPAILPGRGRRDANSFITHPLRNSLVLFQRGVGVERLDDCAVCIVHKYDAALGTLRVKDYDNIETKRYLDVIEAFLMTEDGGLQCSLFQTTEMSDRDATVFYIMPRKELKTWLENHQ